MFRLRHIRADEIVVKREEYEKLQRDSATLKRVLIRLTAVMRRNKND